MALSNVNVKCYNYLLLFSGSISTYDREINYGNIKTDSGWTYGGYSERHTVPERFIIIIIIITIIINIIVIVRFIIKIPDGFPLESAGPVFCAGITMFSPLTNWGANKV